MLETKDHPPGIVLEENIRGYTIGGKPLRPARVKVSREPEKKPLSSEDTSHDRKEEE
jgi:molecular chaperone GrpE